MMMMVMIMMMTMMTKKIPQEGATRNLVCYYYENRQPFNQNGNMMVWR